jgi:hypothetical protein
MILRVLMAAAAAFVAASGLAQTPPKTEEAVEKRPSCDGELFEFSATSGSHVTRVTLCGKKDATSAELAAMFKNAVAALQKNSQLDSGRRDQLVAQIKAKIAEVEGLAAASAIAPSPSIVPTTSNEAKPEYSALPPLPAPKPVTVAPSASNSPAPEYSVLPPLPAPTAVAAAAATSLPPLSRPRINIDCFNPAEVTGAGPCSELGRDTRVRVRAGETVPAGTSLRFVRRGDFRAEVDLAQLAAGKSIQFLLPHQVCAGVVESKVEIQVVRKAGVRDSAGRVVDSMGPYLLRC